MVEAHFRFLFDDHTLFTEVCNGCVQVIDHQAYVYKTALPVRVRRGTIREYFDEAVSRNVQID